MSDALGMLMRSARRRSLLAATVRAASRGLAVGAGALIGAALCHRFVASAPATLAALLLLAPIAIAMGMSWRRRPTSLALAGAIDRQFATRSLIASAWAARSDTPTPAARIVLADANARAAELRTQLPALWPVKLPASLAVSSAIVLAATLLLVQPGALTRIDRSVPAATQVKKAGVGAEESATDRDTRARAAARANASGDRGAVADEALADAHVRAAASAEGGGHTEPAAAGDAGDAPGRAAGAAGVQATGDISLFTRWQERARLAGGRAAGTADADSEPPVTGSSAGGGAAPIAAARADQRGYEPLLAPALAAYVSAAARKSRR